MSSNEWQLLKQENSLLIFLLREFFNYKNKQMTHTVILRNDIKDKSGIEIKKQILAILRKNNYLVARNYKDGY